MFVFDDLIDRDLQKDAAAVAERLVYFHNKTPVKDFLPIEQEANAQPWQGESDLPEIDAADLCIETLGSAMAHKGCLIVRNFLDTRSIEPLKIAIDRVMDEDIAAADHASSGEVRPTVFHNPPRNLSVFLPEPDLTWARGFHRDTGSVMTVESAGITEALAEWFSSLGFRDLLEAYLGEPACLSALKWVLRRTKFPIAENGWHQDGAFMGKQINSLNMWMPLDHCGGTSGAPGMDIIPFRFHDIVAAGTDDAVFNWSAGPESIERFQGDQAPVSPVFHPGDIFLFDHLLLHRTQFGHDFSRPRYAIETWFFGERNFPKNQIPMKW